MQHLSSTNSGRSACKICYSITSASNWHLHEVYHVKKVTLAAIIFEFPKMEFSQSPATVQNQTQQSSDSVILFGC